MPGFEIRTELPIPASTFWAGMSMEAVNAELMPLVRMTVPTSWRAAPIGRWQTGKLLFRSWILLFGVLPVDLHALKLEEIREGTGFKELSSSMVNRVWMHERWTEPHGERCVLVDRVTVQGRLPPLTSLLMPVYRWVFRHRHAQLKRMHANR